MSFEMSFWMLTSCFCSILLASDEPTSKMIAPATLLVVTGIIIALYALVQSTSVFFTAQKRTRAAVSRLEGVRNRPERDVESPTIFIEPKDQTTECLTSELDFAGDTDNHGTRTASASLFDKHASWTNILYECRRMESHSHNWERLSWRVHHGTNQPDIQENEVLTVKAQRNSCKSPPSKDSKSIPTTFAITSMRHLIELAAFLGLRWIIFESHKIYSAVGNGLTLSGAREKGIGLVFQLRRNSPALSAQRIIPAVGIRELCFGVIPTFYREVESNDTYSIPLDTPIGLETLRVGTRDKVAKTLFTIGCSRESIASYLEKEEGMGLIPVAFEIIGMLAQTIHIKDRCFTYIPNPTSVRLNKISFSLQRLLSSFYVLLLRAETQQFTRRGERSHDLGRLRRIASHLDEELPEDRGHSLGPLHQNELHIALDELDLILKAYHKALVLDVLRCHLEEILQVGVENSQKPTPHWDSLSGRAFVSKDALEQETMERYFHVIRRRVVTNRPRKPGILTDLMERDAVWLALVLRMICWLSLHNFHKDDILAPDYEADRSNTLVYITALTDLSPYNYLS